MDRKNSAEAMSIVILTIQEEGMRIFANNLYRATNGGVRLVIIQRVIKRKVPFFKQIKNFYKNGGLMGLLEEIWFAVLLRVSRRYRDVLNYFRERSVANDLEREFLAETMEIESHNNTKVLETLKKLSPDLLVIWGNTIINSEILDTAKHAINLHMGLCPYYRGSVANQYAFMLEPERVGATVHYVEAGVDTGDIIETITANSTNSPREMLRDLNDRAERLFLEIATKLHSGEKLKRDPQDKSVGKNFMLKDWTPRARFRLARLIIGHEDGESFDKIVSSVHNNNM